MTGGAPFAGEPCRRLPREATVAIASRCDRRRLAYRSLLLSRCGGRDRKSPRAIWLVVTPPRASDGPRGELLNGCGENGALPLGEQLVVQVH